MTTKIYGPLADGREINYDSFLDITGTLATVVDFTPKGKLVVVFAEDLTGFQRARCWRRITTSPAAEQTAGALATADALPTSTVEQRLARLEAMVAALAATPLGTGVDTGTD